MKKFNIIIIHGYLTNQEESVGKSALWCDGRIEVVTDFNPANYSYPAHQLAVELEKANSHLWELAQVEGWIVIPVAAAEEIELEPTSNE